MRTYTGVVTEGKGRARSLGFPTINIPLTDGSLSGIYAGKVGYGGKEYLAAVYADQRRRILEAHLIDFSESTAAGTVRIALGDKIRDDMMFIDDHELKKAIAKDVAAVRSLTRD